MENNLNIDDELVLDIKRLGINGEGIAYYNKLAIFINNTIPGEKVKVKITTVYDKRAIAEVLEYIKTSDKRVEVKCPYYDKCGGCQTSHIDNTYMGNLKRDMVIEALQRYTDINPRKFEIKPTIIMDNNNGYRYKSSLPVRKFNDKSTVGLYDMFTQKIVYIDSCLIQNDEVNTINTKVLEFIDQLNVIPFKENFKRGEIKYIVTRVSHFNKEAQVTLVTHEKTPKIFNLAKEIINIKNVVSVYEAFDDSLKDGFNFFNNLKLLEGKESITESIGNYKFDLLPNAFFQLNPIQVENLYEVIRKACKLSMKETLLDAYCGVGTIGLYLSKFAAKIIGIESNEQAIINAKANAVKNKVRNANFYHGDVAEVLPTLLNDETKIDVVVVDPPRVGLSSEFCDLILEVLPKTLIYVSCNPATLAKDLNILTSAYDIRFIQPVDMFPQTAHVECVVSMSRK